MRRALAGLIALGIAVGLSGCGGSNTLSEAEAIAGIRELVDTDESDSELREAMRAGCDLMGLMSERDQSKDEMLDMLESELGTLRAMNLVSVQFYATKSICPEYQDWFSTSD